MNKPIQNTLPDIPNKRGRPKGIPSEKRLYKEKTKSAKVPASWRIVDIAAGITALETVIARWEQQIGNGPRWTNAKKLLQELYTVQTIMIGKRHE